MLEGAAYVVNIAKEVKGYEEIYESRSDDGPAEVVSSANQDGITCARKWRFLRHLRLMVFFKSMYAMKRNCVLSSLTI